MPVQAQHSWRHLNSLMPIGSIQPRAKHPRVDARDEEGGSEMREGVVEEGGFVVGEIDEGHMLSISG